MQSDEFVDYYEVLEISQNANVDTIERVFRYLAKRCHPDVAENVDTQRFSLLAEAFDTLKDPESRAAYDEALKQNSKGHVELLTGAEATSDDSVERHKLLTLFYSQRRRDYKQPGVGVATLEQIVECPVEVLNFHLWYFRQKGWIEREESGLLAITALGVDQIEAREQQMAIAKRIEHERDPNAASVAKPRYATSK